MGAHEEMVRLLSEQAGLSEKAAGWVALSISLLRHVKVPEEEYEKATKVVAAMGYQFTHPGHPNAIGVTVYKVEA